jgi:hypothetical protein
MAEEAAKVLRRRGFPASLVHLDVDR